jgi:gliding motility-associated-like protein
VPNPSFENYTNCYSTTFYAYDTAAYSNQYLTTSEWFAPNYATADYYNTCAPIGYNRVPNPFSIDYQQPKTGNAFAGIILYDYFDLSYYKTQNVKEYLQTKLQSPLVKNKKYCVSFYISAAINFGQGVTMISDDVSVAFTKDRIHDFRVEFIQHVVTTAFDCTLYPSNYLPIGKNIWASDTSQWYKVKGVYTAQGSERWLTIGNFKSNSQTATRFLFSAPAGGVPWSSSAYVYIDDVSVIELPNVITNTTKRDTTVCGFPFNLHANTSHYQSFEWQNGSTDTSFTVRQPGVYWLKAVTNECGTVIDTITVRLRQPPTALHFADTLLCVTNLPLRYTVPPVFTHIQWSDNTSDNPKDITKSGIYSLAADWECGTVRNTFLVRAESPLPPIHLLTQDTASCEKGHFQPFRLYAPYGYPNYTWNIGAQNQRAILIQKAGDYDVRSQNLCGEVSDKITVSGCAPSYYLPNTFTPNGDGKNDFFTLYSNDAVRIIKQFQVFDRYGELVFSAENIAPNDERKGWDGNFKDMSFTPDVFAYRITVEYADGTTETLVGDVTVVK